MEGKVKKYVNRVVDHLVESTMLTYDREVFDGGKYSFITLKIHFPWLSGPWVDMFGHQQGYERMTNIINNVGNIINYQRTSVVDHIIHTYGLTKEEVENYYIVLGYGLKLERKLGDFFNSL